MVSHSRQVSADAWPRVLGERRLGAPLVLVSVLAATAFCIVYVRSEQPIYFWDWSHHFNLYKQYGALLAQGDLGWLTALLQSMRYDDYNLAALTPMLPTYAAFGSGRAPYIVTIVVLYLLPAAFLAARLAMRTGAVTWPTAWLLALLFWPLWIAALRGMPDIAGLIPLGYATLIVLETRFLTRASIFQGVKLGLLVWLAFLLRRWYAYACVSLELTTLAFAAWTVLGATADRNAASQRATAAFATNGVTVVAGLLAFQAPLVVRILGTRYADLYDAYQKPLFETAHAFLAQAGLVVLVAAAAGLVRAARNRNTEIGFTAITAALTAVMFLRTQAPSVQHILPFVFWLFPAAVSGAAWPFAATPRARMLGQPLLVAGMLAGWASVLVPAVHRPLAAVGLLLPTEAYPPLVLQNRAGYDALVADLKAQLRDPADRVAVFASSPALSGSLLDSFAPDLPLVEISNVDKRDGLRLAPLAAHFAVATETPTLHLPERSQRVVQIPNAMIIDARGPGAAYLRIAGPYLLDDGVRAWIYRRDRPWSLLDTDATLQAIRAFYPDWTLNERWIGP